MSEVIYDSILGKIREGDTGGGGGGSGTVTGIESVVNGGTATVTATGGSGAVKFVGVSGTTISSNGSGEIEIAGGAETVISGGYRTTVTSSGGSATVDQDKWFPITNVTGASVTMQPGEAYVIQATTAAVTINTTTIPENQFGLESHLEIFVANTGYVVTGTNVVLANALEPDSVNNCTVRFHDGLAIISVEDHVAGYVVTVNAASGAGSLNYGLATASNGYISIDASLNGQTLDLGAATTNGEKHVVGNGYTETIVSGGISCTSKTTFSNLSMSGVVNSGGTMTLGDVYIPNGATVAVSGGGLAVEKVTGNDGLINLGGTTIVVPVNGNMTASGCTFSRGGFWGPLNCAVSMTDCAITGATITDRNCFYFGTSGSITSSIRLSGCTVSGNYSNICGGILLVRCADAVLENCTVTGNTAAIAGVFRDVEIQSGTKLTASNCTLGKVGTLSATLTLAGSNTVDTIGYRANLPGSVIISSGASVNLTSSIAPGGGITVLTGGCTVNGNAIAAGTYTSIDSTGTPT